MIADENDDDWLGEKQNAKIKSPKVVNNGIMNKITNSFIPTKAKIALVCFVSAAIA
jgi:hypothetical protein